MNLNAIRDDIRSMSAYPVPTLAEDAIKLDAMELPYMLPESLRQQLAHELANAPINRYPNPVGSGLAAQIRATFAVPDSAQIALGNGSDELIALITQLVAKPHATVLSVAPSFVMYQHNARLLGMNYVGVPLNADFTLNLDAMLAAIAEHQPALIFLAYPNNPTGVPFARDEVEQIIAAATGLVVIDEAYGAFAQDSFLARAGQPEHLLVLRTLSKIGFAGLRLGFVAGSAAVLDELAKILPPYNMNQLSLIAGKFALQHMDKVNHFIDELKIERANLRQALNALPETQAFESHANFITVRLPKADEAFERLKQNNIWVKKLSGSHALLSDCLRLTIGTPEQNVQMLRVLQQHSQAVEQSRQTGNVPKGHLRLWLGVVLLLVMAAVVWYWMNTSNAM